MSFAENRSYLEDEFAQTNFCGCDGDDSEQLAADIMEMLDQRQVPMVLLKGQLLSHFLTHVQIAVNPHSIFPCIMNAGINYGLTAGGSVLQNVYSVVNKRVLSKEIPEIYAKTLQALEIGVGSAESDFWHTMPDFQTLLDFGLKGLHRVAEKKSGSMDEEHQYFYISVLESLDAVLMFCSRCEALCRMNGLSEAAEAYAAIIERAPENTYQAMLLMNVYLECLELGVERGRTLGMLDRMMLPFYLHDSRNGMTTEEIKELYRYFFMRFSAARRFAAQPFAIGGTLENGEDACNELTDILLDVFEELDIRNPKIHIRCHKRLPERILRRALDLIRKGNSAICLINDEAVIAGYKKIGISREEASGFVPFGCYEPMLMGKEDAMIGASWMNIAKAVEFAIYGGYDPIRHILFTSETPLEIESFDAFLDAFYIQLDGMVDYTVESIDAQTPYQMRINPSPLYSATLMKCLESGKDVFDNGLPYNNTSIKCCGIATAVDALMAVKSLVFDRREVSLSELRRALRANWKGYESLRRKALMLTCRFGNGIPEADQLARDIYKHLAGKIVNRPNVRGGVYRMGCDSITKCIDYGACMGATPDGRKAGEPFSKNFCPSTGMEREGITAYIQSVCRLDSSDFVDAGVLDFTLHPTAVSGEKGMNALLSLIRVYFAAGGYAIQGNILSPETLMDAQIHPEKYKNLQVRLCGWNEYFVDMEPVKQNALIMRLQGSEA